MSKQNKQSKGERIKALLQSAFQPADPEVAAVVAITNNDLRNATLIVSVFINAFVLTSWLVLEVAAR